MTFVDKPLLIERSLSFQEVESSINDVEPEVVMTNKMKEGVMNHVEIYTTKTCPYCDKAKKLLMKKSVSYHEVDVSSDAELRQSMTDRANGRRTVPQIFINSVSIGGCDDLYALDAAGKLDMLLKDTQ